MKYTLTLTLLLVLFVLSPSSYGAQQHRSYRGYIACNILLYNTATPTPSPSPAPSPYKCQVCKDKGYIVQADGHKVDCYACSGSSGDDVQPSVNTEDVDSRPSLPFSISPQDFSGNCSTCTNGSCQRPQTPTIQPRYYTRPRIFRRTR